MVGAVGVEMLVTDTIAGADHEGRADLPDAPAGLVHVVPALRSLPSRFPRTRVHELEPVERTQRSGARRGRVVVDENEKRDPFVVDESLGVSAGTRSDRRHAGPRARGLLRAGAQLA